MQRGLFMMGLTCLLACAGAEGGPTKLAAAPGKTGPVLVELFTSQGCSSCPPADQVLATLAAAGASHGVPVAPLAFHVDYWNDLGWADPYSTSEWSARQRDYAAALHDTRVYTPEIIVAGRVGMVGSARGKVLAAIAATPPPALLLAKATWSATMVSITATAPPEADVMAAIWEEHRENAVATGENAGAILGSTRVVRALVRVATAGHTATIEVPIDPTWKAPGAVAFAQRTDARVIATAMLPR